MGSEAKVSRGDAPGAAEAPVMNELGSASLIVASLWRGGEGRIRGDDIAGD